MNCLKRVAENNNYYHGESVKTLVEYYETQLNKTFNKDLFAKYCSEHCFCLNRGIDVNSWSGKELKTYLDWVKGEKIQEQKTSQQQINIHNSSGEITFNSNNSLNSSNLNNSGKNSPVTQSTGNNAKQNQDNSGWITLGFMIGVPLFGFFLWFLFAKFRFWHSRELSKQ